MFKKQSGFTIVEVLVGLVIVAVVGFAGWQVLGGRDSAKQAPGSPQASGSDCAQPILSSPADLSLATSVLYPGQSRGGDYKPHGGLRFDGSKNDDITVRAPLEAKLTSGSRYIEQGETQHLLEFESDCKIKYRFDHLLTLSRKLQSAVDDNLPPAKRDDSRTTNFKSEIEVKTGEVIATAVGFRVNQNVSFDFGVYDMRKDNGTNPSGNELARHGVCWLHGWLPPADSAKLAVLPAGDGKSGKTSDYCR